MAVPTFPFLPPAMLALDEHSGGADVRAAATVFIRMALQLRQVFEARGLMIAAISHDLRTPLTRLRMRLETTPLDTTFQRRSVAELAEMNALIDAVLEVFRSSDGGGSTGPGTPARRAALAQLRPPGAAPP